MRGVLITFEGVEGSGKTTQMLRLARWLKRQGFAVEQTREPDGTPLGQGRAAPLRARSRAADRDVPVPGRPPAARRRAHPALAPRAPRGPVRSLHRRHRRLSGLRAGPRSRADPRAEPARHGRRAARPHAALRPGSGRRLSPHPRPPPRPLRAPGAGVSSPRAPRVSRDPAGRAQARAHRGRRPAAGRGRRSRCRRSWRRRSVALEAIRDQPRAVELLRRALAGGRSRTPTRSWGRAAPVA